jgi:hypothetical protein
MESSYRIATDLLQKTLDNCGKMEYIKSDQGACKAFFMTLFPQSTPEPLAFRVPWSTFD